MPIQVQASDAFNPDALIPPGGKQLWTFYGVDGTYRNHYGVLHMMGYDDKPTERFRPVLIRYKGKIYPGNRVHTSWPAIETAGQAGLMQPRMSDIHKMWKSHSADSTQHPALAVIVDDNGDGIVEVNRPEEIDSLIAAITRHLRATGYPLDGKRVVWVMNNRVYRSGMEFSELDAEPWEASPYGNVHKYNHDVQPARAALGTNGCSDCHSSGASFFSAAVLAQPFDSLTAHPVWRPNNEILGISSLSVGLGSVRESMIKPAALWALGTLVLLLLLHAVVYGRHAASEAFEEGDTVQRFTLTQRLMHYAALASFLILAVTGLLFFASHRFLNGAPLRDLHTWAGLAFGVGWVVMLFMWLKQMRFARSDRIWFKNLGGYFGYKGILPSGTFNAGQKAFFWLVIACGFALVLTGAGMALFRTNADVNLAVFYTVHDLVALFLLLLVVAHAYFGIILNPHSLRSIFGGQVSRRWLGQHHPQHAGE
jgi:formate dehydrogenase subunit gamma